MLNICYWPQDLERFYLRSICRVLHTNVVKNRMEPIWSENAVSAQKRWMIRKNIALDYSQTVHNVVKLRLCASCFGAWHAYPAVKAISARWREFELDTATLYRRATAAFIAARQRVAA